MMVRQHSENLFRRFKGQVVTIKTVSGGIYEGRIAEITNDYVCLIERQNAEPTQVFLFFTALESMMVVEVPTS
jgi:hypothetical protein